MNTRLFYITESEERNRNIFATYEEAIEDYWTLVDEGETNVTLKASEVAGAYYDPELKKFNYDERADTFMDIKEYKPIND